MSSTDAIKKARHQSVMQQERGGSLDFSTKMGFEKGWTKAYQSLAFSTLQRPQAGRLVKRDDSSTADVDASTITPDASTPDPSAPDNASPPSLPPAPAHSGSATSDDHTDHPEPPVASSVPVINYGSATPEKNDPPPTSDNSAAATPDDAQPPTDFTLPPSASGDGTVSDSSSPTKSHSHRVTGIVTGVIFGVIILLALSYFFKRYRQKLTRCCTSKDGAPRKRHRGKKSQRLGSIDGLKPFSRNGGGTASEDKTGSSDFLVTQVAPEKAGPFDRAISSMFTSPNSNSPPRGGGESVARPGFHLNVTLPKSGGLVHQRSLDSIAEVQEPKSGASSTFAPSRPPTTAAADAADAASRPSQRDSVFTIATTLSPIGNFTTSPKRMTWNSHRSLERPLTSPGKFGTTSPPSAFASFQDAASKSGRGLRLSPARPQSAKGGDIEMTRQGSTLVIRDKPSSGCIRRPISSAGSGFRSALRKTRGLGEEDDASAICVETDDIVDHGHDTRVGRRDTVLEIDSAQQPSESTSAAGEIYDVAVPTTERVRELRSHFSSSTLRTQARESCATSVSPCGSFSFEIKDAVRRHAPVKTTLAKQPREDEEERGDTPVPKQKEQSQREEEEKRWTDLSVESFVKDLDRDLQDCRLTDESWSPPKNVISSLGR